ncbi:unnamed protein product [Ectocarpus fasciculatus]
MVEGNDERVREKGTQGLASGVTELVKSHEPEVPPSGAAMKRFIQETLPEMTRLTKTLERSNVSSGVGGFFYHSNMAYMKAVDGDLEALVRSLQACVAVVLRYPGMVRFRPHFVHCTLVVSHFSNRRDMYDAMKDAYNSIRPGGCWRAPPYEEWRTVTQICDNIFCRSFEAEIHNARHGQEPVQTDARGCEDVTSGPALGLMTSPCSGAEHESSGSPPAGLASEERWPPPPATATGATMSLLLAENLPAPPSLLQDGVGHNDEAGDFARDMRWQPAAETAMLITESAISAKAEEGGDVRADRSGAAAASGQPLCSGGDNAAAAAAAAAAAIPRWRPRYGEKAWRSREVRWP